ncbi:MAG: DUF5058 family protein [Clostridia bacterium]|nr:DUF5058 family protein [Clostridia bacterium]
MFADFKNDKFMYLIVLAVIVFVCAQALFFLRKAWIRGKELGISTDKLKNAVTSSAIFSFAPAVGIAITVISLSVALGYVLPWIRLTVIGAIQYETTAAIGAIQAATNDPSANIAVPITDPQIFSEITWVMTLGSILPLILIPIVLKKIQKGVSDVASKNSKWMDIMTAAAFIGLISAFIAKGLAGMGSKTEPKIGDGAGVLSLAALVFSTGFMIFFTLLNKKLKKNWIEALSMPVSMALAMIAVVLINTFAPSIAQIEWRY